MVHDTADAGERRYRLDKMASRPERLERARLALRHRRVPTAYGGIGGDAMLDEMLTRITQIEERAAVRRVFGEPVREHGRTVIPVARVAYGFGFGGGRDAGPEPETTGPERGARTGGGGGGGLRVAPVAVVEMTDADTRVHPVVDVTRLALAGLLLAGWGIFWITLTVRVVARSRS